MLYFCVSKNEICMIVKDIISIIEDFASLSYQESYDNAGLIIGNEKQSVSCALLTIDVTEEVINEAIQIGADIIISHHPLIFSGIKKINEKNDVERCVFKAIKNNIAIYAAHTNLDATIHGVNAKISDKIGLKDCKILNPKSNFLYRIETFVPINFADKVASAMFEAGAGSIGNYDSCSFVSEGKGSFKANENAHPYVGTIGEIHKENESKIEVICPKNKLYSVIASINHTHPYEEPVIDIIPLENSNSQVGSGMIGVLSDEVDVETFLLKIKEIFNCSIRYTKTKKTKIKKVALCGGAGSFLISDAKRAGADIFLTGDVKYHDFFLSDNELIIADIGHYESEQYTKEIFYEIISKKFPKFALQFSKVITNPINYL